MPLSTPNSIFDRKTSSINLANMFSNIAEENIRKTILTLESLNICDKIPRSKYFERLYS